MLVHHLCLFAEDAHYEGKSVNIIKKAGRNSNFAHLVIIPQPGLQPLGKPGCKSVGQPALGAAGAAVGFARRPAPDGGGCHAGRQQIRRRHVDATAVDVWKR